MSTAEEVSRIMALANAAIRAVLVANERKLKAAPSLLADVKTTRAALESAVTALVERAEAGRVEAERYQTLRHSLSNKQGCTSTRMPRVYVPLTDGAQTYTPDGLDKALDDEIAARQQESTNG